MHADEGRTRPAADAEAAVDSHVHVFRRDLPIVATRRYSPDYDAPPDRLAAVLDANRIARAVLVQPSFLGTDNGYLCDAIAARPDRFRGVAVVDPDVGDAELARLVDAGIVGCRLNRIDETPEDVATPRWARFFGRLAAHGLHAELHCAARELPRLVPPILDAGVAVVVDHFGRPDPRGGGDDSGIAFLVRIARTARVHVKLSAPYRLDRAADDPRDDAAVDALARRLVDAFGPTRLVWGSDWPHTRFEASADYATLRARLDAWLPDTAARRTVLVETPRALYRFADAAAAAAESSDLADPASRSMNRSQRAS